MSGDEVEQVRHAVTLDSVCCGGVSVASSCPQFSIESDELRRCDLSSVQAMLSSVSSLLQLLTDPRTKHLLLMKSSARYLDRLAGSVLSPLLLANKATAQVLSCDTVCVREGCGNSPSLSLAGTGRGNGCS